MRSMVSASWISVPVRRGSLRPTYSGRSMDVGTFRGGDSFPGFKGARTVMI
jgi:hypothetical protein